MSICDVALKRSTWSRFLFLGLVLYPENDKKKKLAAKSFLAQIWQRRDGLSVRLELAHSEVIKQEK